MPRFGPTLSAPLLEGWFAKESITLLAPDGKANVIASSEPLDETVDTRRYAEVQGELLVKEFPGFEEYSFEQAEIFGERSGFMRRFQWVPPDGVPIMQVQLYYAEAGRGYTATATTPTTEFTRYESDLQDVLEGLLVGPVEQQRPMLDDVAAEAPEAT